MGLAAFIPSAQAATISSGDLIKASTSAVYYYAADAKRYVFPNEKTYKTWYADFSGVKIITDAELAAIQISGNVTYRPGVKMVKIITDPKVYAVATNGTLRWVTTESLAASLYGLNWRTMIDDVPDAFFINYNVGAPINNVSDYSPAAATAASLSINADKSLIVPTTGSVLNIFLAPDTPVAGNIVPGTVINFTKLNLQASGADINIRSMAVSRFGISSNSDLSDIKIINQAGQTIASAASLNSNNKALITFNPVLVVSANITISLTLRASVSANITSGQTIALGIAALSDLDLVSGAVSASFPVVGKNMSSGALVVAPEALTPPEGILIAGRSKQGVAIFKVSAGQAEDMDLNSVIVTDTGTGKVASSWYLYSNLRSDGKSISDPIATGIMNSITKKVSFILTAGTVIIPASGSASLTVAVDVILVDGATVKNGDTLQAIVANATDIIATGKASGAQINGSAVTNTTLYNVLASWPYFSLDPASPKNVLVPGINTLLAIYDVTADAADQIDFLNAATNSSGLANKLTVNIAHSCTAGIGSGFVLQDEAGNILDSQAVDVCNSNSVTFSFGNPTNLGISAGATKKLYIYADTRGAKNNGDTIQLYLSDSNLANLDFAINGAGNYQFAQYAFRNNIYASPLAR